MATRSDVKVEFNASPRVLQVDAPSEIISIQDIVDSVRKQEDTFSGMSHPKLLDAAGKSTLGTGIKTGITATLQNTVLSFEGRFTPAQIGTATSTPSNPINGRQTLIDNSASFVTNNVRRGSFIINFSDMSVSDVIVVNSESQLECRTLSNGTLNSYTLGDTYHIFNISQVRANEGNLVAIDDVGNNISPVLPTAFTQVVVELSTSASLVESGTSGLTGEESVMLQRLFQRMGLDSNNPLDITDSSITFAGNTLTITQPDGSTTRVTSS